MILLPLIFLRETTHQQRWIFRDRRYALGREYLLNIPRFRVSVVTSSEEEAAEPEKSNCGDHAGHSSQRSGHQNSERKSEEEQTSYPSQRPLRFQHWKPASVKAGKYHERRGSDEKPRSTVWP
jgi:hypothetical protein